MKDDIKITSEELFDDKKYILDEKDIFRINKNIELLKKMNLPYLEHMRTVPINCTCKIKSKDEILKKLLVDFTLAVFSIYSDQTDLDLINGIFGKLDKKLNIKSFLTDKEVLLIDDIIEGNMSSKELNNISWILERIPIYLWALGFIDKPSSKEECDINEISKIIFKYSNYDDFLKKCNLRSEEEILEYSDLICRYHYACRYLRINDKPTNEFNENILEEQEKALLYISSFDLNKLVKDSLKVECETKDIKFEFKIPFYLTFIKAEKKLKEIVSLKTKDNKTRITITDLGECDEDDFENKVNRFINMLCSVNFNIINVCHLTSQHLEKKIIQIVMDKEFEDSIKALNSYFMLIGNHIIKVDSIINENTNYKDYNDLINSFNSSIDMDIVLSMKFDYYVETGYKVRHNKILDIYNEHTYSNVSPTDDNIFKLFGYCNRIFNKFNEMLNEQNVNQIQRGDDCGFNIIVYFLDKDSIIYNNFEEFKKEYVNINGINKLELRMNLQYLKFDSIYENEFIILFKPYAIKFSRNSNHEQKVVDQIEEAIVNVFDKLKSDI